MNEPLKLTPFDAAHYLKDDEEAQIELLSDALSSGHAPYITHALKVIARAQGMSQLARETGLNRSALYDAMGADGNPTLDTLLKLLSAMKLKISGVEKAA